MKKYITGAVIASIFAQVFFAGLALSEPKDQDTYLACSDCGKKDR